MHDHATDGGIADYHDKASAREVRLHLDNAHNFMTTGWSHDRMVDRHEAFHGEAELLAAPPAFRPCSVYLRDGNDTLYLAEQVDPRHMPAAGPIYRLTAQVPPAERVVDLLEATKASLAASRAYLDAHKESETAQPSGSPAEVEPRPAGRTTSAGAPSPVVDLMEALEASLAAAKADRSPS